MALSKQKGDQIILFFVKSIKHCDILFIEQSLYASFIDISTSLFYRFASLMAICW